MGASMQGASGAGGRRARRRRHNQPIAEINVTPFVDVMLVLLIIFMVAAPLLTVGVPIDLPESRAKPLEGATEPLTISVKADGEIYLQESPIALEDLEARLLAGSPGCSRIASETRQRCPAKFLRSVALCGGWQSKG